MAIHAGDGERRRRPGPCDRGSVVSAVGASRCGARRDRRRHRTRHGQHRRWIGNGVDAPLLSDEAARRDPFLLAFGRAGVFQVGMSIDTLYQRIPRTLTTLVDQQAHNHFMPAIEIRLDQAAPQPAMVALYRELAGEWRVCMLNVIDPRFRTVDNLGVGSTLVQIRAISPDVQPRFDDQSPFAQLPDRGLTFWFDHASVVDHTLPDTAVVTRCPWTAARSPSHREARTDASRQRS
jgi:hypothetical protein